MLIFRFFNFLSPQLWRKRSHVTQKTSEVLKTSEVWAWQTSEVWLHFIILTSYGF